MSFDWLESAHQAHPAATLLLAQAVLLAVTLGPAVALILWLQRRNRRLRREWAKSTQALREQLAAVLAGQQAVESHAGKIHVGIDQLRASIDRVDNGVLVRLAQDVELLQALSPVHLPRQLGTGLEAIKPILQKAGWREASNAEKAETAGVANRVPVNGMGPPLGSAAWFGPGDQRFPAIFLEPNLDAEALAAALAGSPAVVKPPAPPLLPAREVAVRMLCAGLWADWQWTRRELESVRSDDSWSNPAAGERESSASLFRKARDWRRTQVKAFASDWEELPGDGQNTQPRMVVMEPIQNGPETIEDMAAVRSRSLDATLPAARLVQAPPPAFQVHWKEGQALAGLGVPEEDVRLLDTVRRSFSLTWLYSYRLPEGEAGRRERERLTLAWARVVLDVRARDLKRRAGQLVLSPAAFERWDRVTRQLTSDLQAIGWRLAGEADVALVKSLADEGKCELDPVHWTVPSSRGTGTQGSIGPRWVRPPLLPASDAGPRSTAAIGRAELAEPAPAPTPWHASVLLAAWAAEERSSPPATRSIRALWAEATDIDRNLGDAALHGIDPVLKHRVAERYWEPLFALASGAFAGAFGMNPAPGRTDDASLAGRSWLQDLARQMRLAQLLVQDSHQTEPHQFREPADGEPHHRPAVLDAESRETLSYGLLRRGATTRTATAAPASPVRPAPVPPPASTVSAVKPAQRRGPDPTPQLPPAAQASSPASPLAPLDGPPAGDASAWHARVREVFAARRRLSNGKGPDEQNRYRQWMDLAGRIDLRQREFVIDPADDPFKSTVAEEFWAPLYALASDCFGLSGHGGAAGSAHAAGATWLAGMQEVLGMAQLFTVPPGANSNPDWFRDPTGDDPPGRPAVLDMQSKRVFSHGTRHASGS